MGEWKKHTSHKKTRAVNHVLYMPVEWATVLTSCCVTVINCEAAALIAMG